MGRQRCLPCARRGFLTGLKESEAIQRKKCEEIMHRKPVTVRGYVVTVFYAVGSACHPCYRTQSRFLPISSSVIFA